MAKKIKNNSQAAIIVLSQTLAVGESHDLNQFESLNAINQLDSLIDAGTIIINDGTNDLSAAAGKALINGESVASTPIDSTNKGNSKSLRYNSSSKAFEYVNDSPGIYCSLMTSAAPYVSTVATSYTALGRFIYPGSTEAGTITRVLAVVYQTTGSATASIRIYDTTNSLVICELTGFSDVNPTIKDLGTISNVPAGQVIFEVQAKTSASNKTVYVSAVQIKIE